MTNVILQMNNEWIVFKEENIKINTIVEKIQMANKLTWKRLGNNTQIK
jgi:hypothetical protein